MSVRPLITPTARGIPHRHLAGASKAPSWPRSKGQPADGHAPLKGTPGDAAEADRIRASAAGATEQRAQKALPEDLLLAARHLSGSPIVALRLCDGTPAEERGPLAAPRTVAALQFMPLMMHAAERAQKPLPTGDTIPTRESLLRLLTVLDR